MTSSTRLVTVRGQAVRVAVRHGSDARRPLLLCNGIGASLELLEPFVEALDPAVETVRFDVPGVGGSPDPRLPYTIPILARLVGQVIDELGYGEVDILGISWGGGLAQQLAFQNPRRCRRLVLVATATGLGMVPPLPSVLIKMNNQRRYRDPEYARSVAGEIYGGRLREEPELMAEFFRHRGAVGSVRGYAFQQLAAATGSTLPLLPFIRQPTLILAGEDDPLIPRPNAHIMHWLLPNSRLRFYPDGHLGLMTLREELAGVVDDFLAAP